MSYRPTNGQCPCGARADGWRAGYCATCRPRAGARPIVAVVAELADLIHGGATPHEAAAALGTNTLALERRLYRRGYADLAAWFLPVNRAEHNAAKRRARLRRRLEREKVAA